MNARAPRSSLNTICATACLLLCTIAVPALFAQPHPDRPGPPPLHDEETRAEIHETIQLFYLHSMRDQLDLDQKQVLEWMDVLDERREREQTLRERRREASKQLKQLVGQDRASDGELRAAIRDWEKAEQALRELNDEIRGREDSLMTPRQQALRRLIEPRVHESIRRRARHIQSMDHDRKMSRPGDARSGKRIDRLREEDPELFERIQEKRRSGQELSEEERDALRKFALEERRRRMKEEGRSRGSRSEF